MQSEEETVWRLLMTRSVTTHLMTVGGTSTFVVAAGDGATPVVFIGGLGDSTLTWVSVLPALAADCQVITYDRPGLGASAPTTGTRTVAAMVAELNELLIALGTAPAVLVGHSLGGLVATKMARLNPERVAGLLLVDPADPQMLSAPALVALQRFAIALPRVLSLIRLWPRFVRLAARREASAAVVDRALRDALANALVECRVGPLALRTASAEFSGLLAGAEDLTQAGDELPISVPLTILSATSGAVGKRARSSWTANQAALAATSPFGRHVVVDAGHYIHRDRPSVVIDEVRGLLNRL